MIEHKYKALPKIYVACLASYNDGFLHGGWIDLDGTVDLTNCIQSILRASPIHDAEEWAVHDHEFCGDLTEYPGIEALESITETYTEASLGEINWEVLIEFCILRGDELNLNILERYKDSSYGVHASISEWVDELLDSTGALDSLPDDLRPYFDSLAYARDLEINDFFTIPLNNEIHVFSAQ